MSSADQLAGGFALFWSRLQSQGGPASPRGLDAEVTKEVAEGRTLVKAIGAMSATAPLVELKITRRKVHAEDVSIRIHYAGVCHSDIHTLRGDWGPQTYPLCVWAVRPVSQVPSH